MFCFKAKGVTLALHMNILALKTRWGFCLLEGWKMVITVLHFPQVQLFSLQRCKDSAHHNICYYCWISLASLCTAHWQRSFKRLMYWVFQCLYQWDQQKQEKWDADNYTVPSYTGNLNYSQESIHISCTALSFKSPFSLFSCLTYWLSFTFKKFRFQRNIYLFINTLSNLLAMWQFRAAKVSQIKSAFIKRDKMCLICCGTKW